MSEVSNLSRIKLLLEKPEYVHGSKGTDRVSQLVGLFTSRLAEKANSGEVTMAAIAIHSDSSISIHDNGTGMDISLFDSGSMETDILYLTPYVSDWMNIVSHTNGTPECAYYQNGSKTSSGKLDETNIPFKGGTTLHFKPSELLFGKYDLSEGIHDLLMGLVGSSNLHTIFMNEVTGGKKEYHRGSYLGLLQDVNSTEPYTATASAVGEGSLQPSMTTVKAGISFSQQAEGEKRFIHNARIVGRGVHEEAFVQALDEFLLPDIGVGNGFTLETYEKYINYTIATECKNANYMNSLRYSISPHYTLHQLITETVTTIMTDFKTEDRFAYDDLLLNLFLEKSKG